MPIVIPELQKLLQASHYDSEKTKFLIDGFQKGFGIGYEGPENRRDTAKNLPLGEIGTKTDLWNKVMKEVKLSRYAGPFTLEELPFKNFIQSPIGLVPKAGGQTRLIFHLSYNFNNRNCSLNAETPAEKCSVKYRDLDHAIKNCLKLLQLANEKATKGMVAMIFYSKADLKLAFRILPVLIAHRKWLILMAENPLTGERCYFVEKCLPFGASISCALFQEFSNALQYITEFLIKKKDRITNYLDDFLFIALLKLECDQMMDRFLRMCKEINCPVSEEKCEPASEMMVFLGILLNGVLHCLCIPEEKRLKAVNQLRLILSKKKATIKQIQSLTGLLNFLNRAIVPGRAFTRRMYNKLKLTDKNGRKLKQHHHVYLDKQFREDCAIWLQFLDECSRKQRILSRPFLDLDRFTTSEILDFYTNASGTIAYRCFFDGLWTCGTWSEELLVMEPSIEFLELFALCAAILTWESHPKLINTRVIIYCDNQAVVNMVNNTSSSCMAYMQLIRLLIVNGLHFNRGLSVCYIKSGDNILADSLSRQKWKMFWKNAPAHTKATPDEVPDYLFPVEKFLMKD